MHALREILCDKMNSKLSIQATLPESVQKAIRACILNTEERTFQLFYNGLNLIRRINGEGSYKETKVKVIENSEDIVALLNLVNNCY